MDKSCSRRFCGSKVGSEFIEKSSLQARKLASCRLKKTLYWTIICALRHENTAPPSDPMGIRIDSKRRKKLMQKRLAMGHKQDDHEQEQGYSQTLH